MLTDKEDGTLSVQIIADPTEDYSISNHVTNLFLEMLADLQKPNIVLNENQ